MEAINQQNHQNIQNNLKNSSNFSTMFERADYQKALQQRRQNSNQFYKGQKVSYFVDLSHFKMYGVGVYLFFSFIKHCTILFFILSLISVAPIVLNAIKGSTFRHAQNSLSMFLTKTSLGSHKYSIMTDENAYTLSIQYKIFNVAFDILSCLVFLIFCLYWQRKSRKIVKILSKQIKLQSNFAVQVTQFPQSITQSEMEYFMSRFGTISQIVSARDYSQQIQLANKIYQLQLQAKQLQIQMQIEQKQNLSNQQSKKKQTKNITKIEQIKKQIEQLENKLSEKLIQNQNNHQKITRFYIQFETPQQRNQIVRLFQKYQDSYNCFTKKPQQILYNGQDIKIIACNTQPASILWQNAHVSWKARLPRALLQILIVLLVFIGGFLLISYLTILVPQVDSDINTTQLTYKQISKSTNTTIIQSWCNNNYIILNPQQSAYYETCQKYWKIYTHSIIISISISIIIMVIEQIITKIVYLLAQFQQYRSKDQYSLGVMTNLFVMNFLTATFITIMMQTQVYGYSVMDFFKAIVSQEDILENIDSFDVYKDLTPRWYKDIGYQMWFNIFTMIFLPQLTQPLTLFLQQKYTLLISSKKQHLHQKLTKSIEPPQFQLQSLYSQLLLIISTGIIFGGGIQLMMIVVFLCFLVRYFYLRYTFIRFHKIPQLYNQILNNRVISILKIILISRLLVSLYMYGAHDVFVIPSQYNNDFVTWANQLTLPFIGSIFILLSRITVTWYYSIFCALFLLVLVFKERVFGLVHRFKIYWKNRKNITEQQQNNKNNRIKSIKDIQITFQQKQNPTTLLPISNPHKPNLCVSIPVNSASIMIEHKSIPNIDDPINSKYNTRDNSYNNSNRNSILIKNAIQNKRLNINDGKIIDQLDKQKFMQERQLRSQKDNQYMHQQRGMNRDVELNRDQQITLANLKAIEIYINDNKKSDNTSENNNTNYFQAQLSESWQSNISKQRRTQLNIVQSYHLRNNPNYQQVWTIMQNVRQKVGVYVRSNNMGGSS